MDDDETSSEEPAAARRRVGVRRSVSLLTKIQNLDLKVRASLIRSSSTSRRVSIHGEDPQSRTTSGLNYGKQEMLDDIANERISRPTKHDGAELLTLITRSRSCPTSDAKGDKDGVPADTVDVPELLLEDPVEPQPQHPVPVVRPLSAATTNTASTVTPANVTPRKRPPARIPIDTVQEESASAPKQPQVAPKKNYHIFGIALPSPRKSSFGSRPGSPFESSQAPVRRKRSTSLINKSSSKLSKLKPKAETGDGLVSKLFVGNGLRVTSNAEPKISTSKTPTPKHSLSPRKSSGSHFSSDVVAHVSPTTIIADQITQKTPSKQSSRQYMSEVGATARVQESSTPPPLKGVPKSSVGTSATRLRPPGTGNAPAVHVRGSISNPRAATLGPRASTSSPTVTPTLAPRVRSGTAPASQSRSAIGLSARVSSATVTTTSSLSTRERHPSTSSSTHAHHAYRTVGQLGGIEEDRSKGDEVEDKLNNSGIAPGRVAANGNARHVTAAKSSAAVGVASPIMPASVAKSTTTGRKHGSFDFERPGLATTRGTASSSLGTNSRARQDPRRTASGSIDERRGTNAGLAGVGAARLYASTSAAQRSLRVVPPVPPPPPERLQPEHTGGSVSTSASQSHGTAGTSSWGRSTGKRLSAGLTKLTNGLGLGKSSRSTVSGKERQHGKFAFEPPVPALPAGMRRENSVDSAREREREQERDRQWEREEKERRAVIQLAPPMGHKTSHSTSSTTSSTHTGVSAGHRSGTKGRSLDLGLSFSWAPSKVREDAVMPESSFGRSLSASRRERQGKEIADMFRDTLDEEAYRNFKKYVHRFDAHEIPFDGPTGIVTRVQRLLRKARNLDDDDRARLLDRFVKLILQNA